MNRKQQTIDTYNSTAERMAEKFNGIGARVSDIEETLGLFTKKNPSVVEIGCGNGRDAEEILKRTNKYRGIDVAEKFVELAQKRNPQGRFEVADVETFEFPNNIDAVFAFASLIHVPKSVLQKVFERINASFNPHGLFRISMKYAKEYCEVVKEDEFGTRTYYFYSDKDLSEMLKDFHLLKCEIKDLSGQTWIEILAQKI